MIQKSKKTHRKKSGNYGGVHLNKGCLISPILLVFFFINSSSLGLDSFGSQNNNSSVTEIAKAAVPVNVSSHVNEALAANITTDTSNLESPNLKCIWSVSGIEKDQITMALNQDGNDLFGQAKYEPDNSEPWNGVIAGFVHGNQVYLAIAALKGNEKVSTVLNGIFADETISGKFFQASEGNISGSGEFRATWINPDLSGYTPAKVKNLKPKIPAPATNVSSPSTISHVDQQAALQKSRFHDVHQDADRIQTGVGDISQIPIGMG